MLLRPSLSDCKARIYHNGRVVAESNCAAEDFDPLPVWLSTASPTRIQVSYRADFTAGPTPRVNYVQNSPVPLGITRATFFITLLGKSKFCWFTVTRRQFVQQFLRATAESFERLSHRLGVCLSHSWSVSKRCMLGSPNFYCEMPQGLWVFSTKFRAPAWRGFPWTRASKTGTPLKDVILPLLALIVWKRLQIGTA